MKLKTILLGVSMALAFTMPINAAQYTVAYRTKSVCENPYNTRYLLVL